MGHHVVTLAPYHSELNPTGPTRAQIKTEIAPNNRNYKTKEVEILLKRAVANITSESWQREQKSGSWNDTVFRKTLSRL